LDMTARLFVRQGDQVWMEDPGYPGAWAVFMGMGAQLISVPVHAEGMAVEVGKRIAPAARLAYVTPSHQFPLGVTMALQQRLALLQWACEAKAWIVEDDYDSEYRFGARPLEALQGLDDAGRVIYIGTFSKSLFPALRLGYVVVPDAMCDRFLMAKRFQHSYPPLLEQLALTDFLAEGHYARHVRRMRTLYAARLAALLSALKQECGELVEAQAPQAGMHLVGWLPSEMNDTEVEQRAASRGLEAVALSSLSRQPMQKGGLVLGFAGCTAESIRQGVRVLAQILDEMKRMQAS
jgi:GntR family transcriptional regulator / MocR family aminotransferase